MSINTEHLEYISLKMEKIEKDNQLIALNDMLNIYNEPPVTRIVSKDGTVINISQKEIVESLRITHPQHFV